MNYSRHFEPLRPHRVLDYEERYEFTHGESSVCVYDIDNMDFITEIEVGPRPDCHATSMDNRYIYIACEDGLYCIDQHDLEVKVRIETGHVYGTNVMPDGNTMLLHDAYGGIFVLKDIQDIKQISVYKRLDLIGTNKFMDTLGGKGHFSGDGRFYFCNGWNASNIYRIDLYDDYSWEVFIRPDPRLKLSDDLVISRDKTKIYSSCYGGAGESHVTITDIGTRRVVKTISTGAGTCGLTMSNDERYVIASNDADDSISIIDTELDEVVNTISAKSGFEKLNIRGYIQGITVGKADDIFVYGCAGNGALVKFWDIYGKGKWMISYPGGKISSDD